MTRLATSAAAITAFLTVSPVASAGDCAKPPIATADHAVCLARQFAEKPKPPPWELEFKAKETASHRLVYYGPKTGSGVRGGAGDLQIDKKSGAVTLLRGYR